MVGGLDSPVRPAPAPKNGTAQGRHRIGAEEVWLVREVRCANSLQRVEHSALS